MNLVLSLRAAQPHPVPSQPHPLSWARPSSPRLSPHPLPDLTWPPALLERQTPRATQPRPFGWVNSSISNQTRHAVPTPTQQTAPQTLATPSPGRKPHLLLESLPLPTSSPAQVTDYPACLHPAQPPGVCGIQAIPCLGPETSSKTPPTNTHRALHAAPLPAAGYGPTVPAPLLFPPPRGPIPNSTPGARDSWHSGATAREGGQGQSALCSLNAQCLSFPSFLGGPHSAAQPGATWKNK